MATLLGFVINVLTQLTLVLGVIPIWQYVAKTDRFRQFGIRTTNQVAQTHQLSAQAVAEQFMLCHMYHSVEIRAYANKIYLDTIFSKVS
jgi:hypothetical protein